MAKAVVVGRQGNACRPSVGPFPDVQVEPRSPVQIPDLVRGNSMKPAYFSRLQGEVDVGQGRPGIALRRGYIPGGSEYLAEPTALRMLAEIDWFHVHSLSNQGIFPSEPGSSVSPQVAAEVDDIEQQGQGVHGHQSENPPVENCAGGKVIKPETQPDQHGKPHKMAYAYKPDITQSGVQDRHDRGGQEPGYQHHPGLEPREKEDRQQVDQRQPRHPRPPRLGRFEHVSDKVAQGFHEHHGTELKPPGYFTISWTSLTYSGSRITWKKLTPTNFVPVRQIPWPYRAAARCHRGSLL